MVITSKYNCYRKSGFTVVDTPGYDLRRGEILKYFLNLKSPLHWHYEWILYSNITILLIYKRSIYKKMRNIIITVNNGDKPDAPRRNNVNDNIIDII